MLCPRRASVRRKSSTFVGRFGYGGWCRVADLHALGWRCWRADSEVRAQSVLGPVNRLHVVPCGDVVTLSSIDWSNQRIVFHDTRYTFALVMSPAVFLAFFTALGVEAAS